MKHERNMTPPKENDNYSEIDLNLKEIYESLEKYFKIMNLKKPNEGWQSGSNIRVLT
jgi:hypothetical protein